ncbi:MAG: KH domain-containing protein [Canibacter sp.]
MSHDALKEALEHLVTGITHHPDDIQINAFERGRTLTLEVSVNPQDLGRVIGRGGRTVQALRTVMNALAQAQRVRVDIIDTDREESA